MFLSLFAVCFVSATLWPLASEALFVGYLHQNNDAFLMLLIIASLGNTLGSVAMFELAYKSSHWFQRKIHHKSHHFPIWQDRLVHYGSPILALSWLPVVGDLLPIAGGLIKMDRFKVYFWLGFGKTARYSVLSVVTLGLF